MFNLVTNDLCTTLVGVCSISDLFGLENIENKDTFSSKSKLTSSACNMFVFGGTRSKHSDKIYTKTLTRREGEMIYVNSNQQGITSIYLLRWMLFRTFLRLDPCPSILSFICSTHFSAISIQRQWLINRLHSQIEVVLPAHQILSLISMLVHLNIYCLLLSRSSSIKEWCRRRCDNKLVTSKCIS